MSTCRMAFLQAAFLLVAMFANATSPNNLLRITVLDSETRSVSLGGNDVPKNCDQLNFDAYCNNSKTAILTNTMLVQEGNGPPFRIACNIDSKFSRCIPLTKGGSFDAKREKLGLVVYYIDDKGKARKQLYALVDADKKGDRPTPAITAASQTAPPAVVQASSSQSPAPTAAVGSVQKLAPEKVEKAKCDFTSTPAGADITLDGKYVGSTPSSIELISGTHAVVFSLNGFSQWKRDLTVLPGAELTVHGILQQQP
jgi:hypothetical protein